MRKVAGSTVQRYAGVVALVLALVANVAGVVTQTIEQRQANCQTQINQEFLATLKQRSAIGKENTDNINNLIKGVFSAKDPKTAMKYYQDFLTELDNINGELSKAKYPSLHSC